MRMTNTHRSDFCVHSFQPQAVFLVWFSSSAVVHAAFYSANRAFPSACRVPGEPKRQELPQREDSNKNKKLRQQGCSAVNSNTNQVAAGWNGK